METYKSYGIDGEIRSQCLKRAKEWIPPTGEEIKIGLAMANWSAVEFARRINANDRTVRRWLGGDQLIPYAAWCVLCAEANLGAIWK